MSKSSSNFPEAHRQILEGKQATPAAYLGSNPERFSYLHLRRTATASRTRPLESALILSRESDSDTYKLYAREHLKHHLNTQR